MKFGGLSRDHNANTAVIWSCLIRTIPLIFGFFETGKTQLTYARVAISGYKIPAIEQMDSPYFLRLKHYKSG